MKKYLFAIWSLKYDACFGEVEIPADSEEEAWSKLKPVEGFRIDFMGVKE